MTQEGGFPISWYKIDNYPVYNNAVSYAIYWHYEGTVAQG